MPPKPARIGKPSSEQNPAKRYRSQEGSPQKGKSQKRHPETSDQSSKPSTSGNQRQEISSPSNVDATDKADKARTSKLLNSVNEFKRFVARYVEHLGVFKSGTRNDSGDEKPSTSMSSNTSVSASTPVLHSSECLQAPDVPSSDNLGIEDMPPADIVKLVYLATTVKRKRLSTRKEIEKTLAETVGDVFLQALNERSFNPVKTFIKEQMVRLEEETYSEKSDKRNWQPKSDFMSWYLSMKHLNLDASSLDRVAVRVRKLCGMADIHKVEGAFMNNENLVMSKICDLMTSEQVSALWDLCSKEKKFMPGFKKITEKTMLDTPGMKELVFFYIIRYLELKHKFNTLYTDLLVDYIRKIRSSPEECTDNLEQVCKILETYEILVQPVGYCLVFCVLEKRKGAKQEIRNITNTFGARLGYKVVVKENPTKKKIATEAKLCSESAALGIYDSFVCILLAHGDTTNIKLYGKEKIKRKDFLQMFARETCFPKKPKLFLMGSCQGGKVIATKRPRGRRNASGDAQESLNVPVPQKKEDQRDIDTVHAESDRLVAYATLKKHAAFRNNKCGSYFVTFICKQIQDLEEQDDQSINVVEVLQRANRKIHSILFETGESEDIQRLGKQACYYESTLQKNFCFRLLESLGDDW